MKSRVARIVLSVALVAGALSALGARPGAAAAPDPIAADALKALDALVSGESCVEKDAIDADVANGVELGFRHCDDGKAEPGGAAGIRVPVAYHPNAKGNDWRGLPRPATDEEAAAAIARDDLRPDDGKRVTLDLDISLPPATMKPPRGGFPILVMAHGFNETKLKWQAGTIQGTGNPYPAWNQTWHYSNAWFAARGYVVVNPLFRGHVDRDGNGSQGTLQLIDRSYEVNDLQYLVGLIVDHDAARRVAGEPRVFKVNPSKVGITGGSYGGFATYLLTTDPTWKSPIARIPIRIAVSVPKFTGTDDIESLVPNGHFLWRDQKSGKPLVAPTNAAKALSRGPIGVVKQSIVAGFYQYGSRFDSEHVIFPQWADDVVARLNAGEPYDGDPVMEEAADRLLTGASAYYQNRFWRRVRNGLRLPMMTLGTTTDPLFPGNEQVRFYNKLRSIDARYPIAMYFGDYDHVYTQNKPKEWGDICGEDRHLCTADDLRVGGALRLLARPKGLIHEGVNTRVTRFIDHYLLGIGSKPANTVAASTTICPGVNATEKTPADEPGFTYQAPTLRALAPTDFVQGWTGGGVTSSGAIDAHAAEADPVARSRDTSRTRVPFCYTTSQTQPGPGVVAYVSPALKEPVTLMGIPTLSLTYETAATDYWIAARVYDRAPNGSQTMVTRSVCKFSEVAPDRTCNVFDLWFAAWTFDKDHQIVIEVTQADTPTFRRHNEPSTITFTEASIRMPVADPDRLADPRA